MRSLSFSVFLLCLISSSASVQGKELSNHLIHKIIENHEHCVRAFEGDKIFINPDKIVFSETGLFLNLNGTELSWIPLLQSDARGCFLMKNDFGEIEAMAKKKTKGPCGNCGQDTDKNGFCTNQDCWFYGLRVL